MRYDKVTFTNGKRIIVVDLKSTPHKTLGTLHRGFEVDASGEQPTPQHLRFFSALDVKKIVPMRVNLKYDTLEPTTDDRRAPFHPDRGDGRATQ